MNICILFKNEFQLFTIETVATSTTTSKDVSTSSVALCKTTTETLLEKTRKISSQQLTDINIQVNSEVFSGEQLDVRNESWK